jgi:hypothetical protein
MNNARRLLRALAPSLIAAALIACSDSRDEPVCNVGRQGIFALPEHEIVFDAPQATSGKTRVVSQDTDLLDITDRIPAQQGKRFGFELTLSNVTEGDRVRVVLEHPSLDPPDGPIGTRSIMDLNPDSIGVFYTFHEAWEAVPGEWVFSIMHRDRLLCRQAFTVYALP